jgi:GH25 family lysozyme M1 (1,4-beta-N-acetylmuramidase)
VRPESTFVVHHASFPCRLISAVAVGFLLFATVAVSEPGHVSAATEMTAACGGVNLRTEPSTAAIVKTSVNAGTRVSVMAMVTGADWQATCSGTTSGDTWYQISEVNGTSVTTLFGASSLYGATGLFVASAPTPTSDPTVPPSGETPTPLPTATIAPTPAPGPAYIEGIDVSNWQGAIDWPAVATAGKRFAYVKASEGVAFVDASFSTNRTQAKAAGLYVGAYHYAQPDATPGDAAAEADHFIDTAQPTAGELLPVLDLEETGTLSATDLQEWTRGFLERVYERSGARCVIYASPNFWKKYMADTAWFAASGYRVLWAADWRGFDAPEVAGADWAGHGWTFWQYTSNGAVAGISGRVDLDRYAGTDLSPVILGEGPVQPPAQDPSLTLAVSASQTVYRDYVTLTVGTQPPAANRPVELQRLSPVDATWTTIASLTTDASGSTSFPYGPPYNTQFRAVFAGAGDLGAATSPPVTVNVLQAGSVRPFSSTTKTIVRGTRITYAAVVRPKAPSGPQTVSFLIYRRVSGAWVYSTSATKVLVNGAATFSWTWSRTGEWYIRVRSNATPYNRASLSPIVKVKVP